MQKKNFHNTTSVTIDLGSNKWTSAQNIFWTKKAAI